MPGVIFLIVIPTANFERSLPGKPTNQMNIIGSGTDTPEARSAMRLEVELRTKRMPAAQQPHQFRQAEATVRRPNIRGADDNNAAPPTYESHNLNQPHGGSSMEDVSDESDKQISRVFIDDPPSSTQLLQQLLLKLDIQHVVWTPAKGGHHYHVVFPLQAGDPCETTLHCLTELKIGKVRGTSVRYITV